MTDQLLQNLRAYKRKFYLNALLKGFLFSLTLLLSAYLVVSGLEYFGRFGPFVRTVFFFALVGLAAFTLVRHLLVPAYHLLRLNESLSDEEAAQQIGYYFPEVSDKLLNTLQLQRLSSQQSDLLQASIAQRARELTVVPFARAVQYAENKRYLPYLLPPVLFAAVLVVAFPTFFPETGRRLIHYNQQFVPEAPFQFVLQNEDLRAFRNEDFTVSLALTGEALPSQVYLITDDRRHRMEGNGAAYSFTFQKVQYSIPFRFEGAGFASPTYEIELLTRPDLTEFNAQLRYPAYLKRTPETLTNTGNLTVPEGTAITWQIRGADTDSLAVVFDRPARRYRARPQGDFFVVQDTATETTAYEIRLYNEHSENRDRIAYALNVVPDQRPSITLEAFVDTLALSYVALAGHVADDYGLSRLTLAYRQRQEGQEGAYQYRALPLTKGQNPQDYFYRWDLTQLELQPGESLDYYLIVYDNDGYNGAKSARTPRQSLRLPSKEEIADAVARTAARTESELDQTLQEAKSLREEIRKTQRSLRGKKSLSFQEKQQLEELLNRQKALNEKLGELREQNEAYREQRNRFEQEDEKIAEKAEQLQEMVEQMLDEETKKLLEELQEMLEKQTPPEQLAQMLEELDNSDENLENELDRALELFKRLRFEEQLAETTQKLEELAEQQEELAQETQQSEEKTDAATKEQQAQEAEQRQQEIAEQFEQSMEELKELNQEMKRPQDLSDAQQEQQNVQQQMQQAQEQLQKQQMKKASQSQQNAADQMKQMAQQMAQMQQQQQQQQAQENLDDLRDILENLLHLSFDQEDLMKNFRNIRQSDPRFVSLSQQQLKLKDDAQIIEDSLLALAERVFQIKSFVTREVTSVRSYMDKSVEAIRQRRPYVASGQQQFAMTSMNNLALLLNDVMKQMQQQMADGMQGQQMIQSQNQPMPGLGQMQQQLNRQLQQLKQSGKTGRQLSEELARMAAQQERIRRALEELNEGQPGGKQGGQSDLLKELSEEMEKTENDLVNKRVTQEVIERQRDIETRLLRAEDALRQRELDKERKAKTAKPVERTYPPALEKYLKAQQRQTELIRSSVPALAPFYQEEVNRYFSDINR